jgi:erythritol transport system ATP-binding protein
MTTTPRDTGPAADVLLEALGIVRRYPGNVALKGVTFRAHRNKINVLIGENGAGKSTLMRILAGVETADEGHILLDGRVAHIRSPRDAAAHGIAIVHQELAILPTLDISENIFAGKEVLRAAFVINRSDEDARSTTALHRLRNPLNLHMPASKLALGCQQMVELARAVTHDTRLLILDEPTSALSVVEAESLFRVLTEMKDAGVTIIYISHRLNELLHLGDTFTVLRSGKVVGEGLRGDVTRSWIVERMSGRAELIRTDEASIRSQAPVVLEVADISVDPHFSEDATRSAVHNISFELHKGEILGVYGLLGAGRTELLEALAGARHIVTGSLSMLGRPIRLANVSGAVSAGIALVPEDRQRDGLFLDLSVRDNIALVASTGPLLSKPAETARVLDLVNQLNIAVQDIELPVEALSGGNQQKVLLARCLMRSPKVLLLDEPTRGVDVSSRAEIYRVLRKLAGNGLSILFTSSEIEETRQLADRTLVMCQGRIAAEFERGQFSDEMLFAAASPQLRTPSSSSSGITA